jgi:hypothetical protein
MDFMNETFQLHATALIASASIAYLSARGSPVKTGVVFVVCFGLIEGIVTGLIRRRLRTLRREGIEFRRSLEDVSLEEARVKALARLASLPGSKAIPASGASIPDELPPSVREVFALYRRISLPTGELLELGTSQAGCVCVGRGLDGVWLVVRNSDEALFELDVLQEYREAEPADYPSIFHWIVINWPGNPD